jgi:DNA-binding NtrC family response regulator
MSKSLNILCVDDEESVLKSLIRIFRGEPFGVLTATSGEKGLAILKEEANIGLIISDQRMPGMSGAAFLAAAKALFPHIPRMILSGFADPTMASDAIKQGDVLHYMHKPWNDAELRRTVHEALQKYLATQATHGDHQEDKEWTVRRCS